VIRGRNKAETHPITYLPLKKREGTYNPILTFPLEEIRVATPS